MKLEYYTHSAEELLSTLQQARAFGLPVGWQTSGNFSYFEGMLSKLSCDDNQTCAVPYTVLWVFVIVYWLIITLITDLFIGLSGPFWYDKVKRLMVFITVASSSAETNPINTQAEQNISDPQTKANEIFSTAMNIRLVLFPQLDRPKALICNGCVRGSNQH